MNPLNEELSIGWARRQWVWDNREELPQHSKWQNEIWLMDQMGTAQVVQEITGFEHEKRFPGSQMLDWLAQDKISRCQLYLDMHLEKETSGANEEVEERKKKRL